MLLQPHLRVAVLGEDDDPLVVPVAIGSHDAVEPLDEHVELGVTAIDCALCPGPHVVEHVAFLGRQRCGHASRRSQGVLPCLFELVLVAEVLLDVVLRLGEHPHRGWRSAATARVRDRLDVLCQGAEERRR